MRRLTSLSRPPQPSRCGGLCCAPGPRWGCDVIVIHQSERVLMDREALAQWTRRSVRVIREHCPVAERGDRGKALYDAKACAELLEDVPQRQRAA